MAQDYSLNALNGHIHDQINRLLNPDLSEEELKKEVARGQVLSQLSAQSIAIAKTYIDAAEAFGYRNPPKLLEC